MLVAALTIVGTLAGILATLVVWLGYRETHRISVRERGVEEIRNIVRDEVKTFATKQQELSNRADAIAIQQSEHTQELHEINDKMGRILDRLAILETKIEVFWKSVAMDAAKIIHSPDPRRAHIDALLEAFMDGTITSDQVIELRKILAFLRDWEPGTPADFPVYTGEQVAAAILLRTMDHAMGSRGKLDAN